MKIYKKKTCRRISIIVLLVFSTISVSIFFPLVLASDSEWQIELTVSIDDYSDVSFFGVHENATSEFDLLYDQIDPPIPPEGIVSYFFYPQNPVSPVNLQKLSSSIIPFSSIMNWSFVITPVSLSGELSISWLDSEILSVPEEFDVILEGPNDEIIDMRNSMQHSFDVSSDSTYHITIKLIEKNSIQPKIESYNLEGIQTDVFNLTDQVCIKGEGFSPSILVDIYAVEDIALWTNELNLTQLTIVSKLEDVMTSLDGEISFMPIWEENLSLGYYDLIVDTNQNGFYDENIDVLDNNDLEISSGLIVIPEKLSISFLILSIYITLLLFFGFAREFSNHIKYN